jgi:hypothetical protein
MTEFYEAENLRDYYKALQTRINDGSIWLLEGSAGRAAMDAIESGRCILGKTPCRDYYGNRIPARSEVKTGTKGSLAYARQLQGDNWVRTIQRVR